MANDYSDPSNLPDRGQGIAGASLSADLRERLGSTQNWCHGQGPCAPVLSQAWANGQCAWNDDQVQDVCVWRIPAMPGHPALSVMVQAESAFGGGTATLRIGGIDSANFNAVGGAGLTWFSDSLSFGHPELDDPASDHRDLSLDLNAAGVIAVHNVHAAFAPLPSPLAGAVAVGGYEPSGATIAVPGPSARPAPAAAGHRFVQNAGVLLSYPQVFQCWSAVRGVQGYTPAGGVAPSSMPAYPHRTVMLPTPGVLRDGGTAKVWIRVLAHEIASHLLVIHAGPLEQAVNVNGLRWGEPAAVLTVDPIADPVEANRIVWYQADIAIPERRWLREFPHPTAAIGLYPGEAGERTTADVLSVSIWGV